MQVHYKTKQKTPFLKEHRETTTILTGGLTWRHEKLIQAALSSLGYKVGLVGTPSISSYETGKSYGNNGQCNPTYFTVGKLVEFLQDLEKQGLSKQQINQQYVFLTAGACGPCRFGMYESEYNLALENAGFGDFRVITFQQQKGIDHANPMHGLDLNLSFHIAILCSITLGDMISEIGFKIRPYENKSGETQAFLEYSIDELVSAFAKSGEELSKAASIVTIWRSYIFSNHFKNAFSNISNAANNIQLDYFQAKPTVKITGEFWAQITEGDGNFHMFQFLEQNNAQLMVEPIGNWIMYMLHQVKRAARSTMGLTELEDAGLKKRWKTAASHLNGYATLAKLSLAEFLYKRYWEKVRQDLGAHLIAPLTNQNELSGLAKPYLNTGVLGGEGHLEVAKNIYYTKHRLAHMVLSLKPFGCMPSTQSDGVQSMLVNKYKDMIFLPLTTSCEGKVNAQSRVLMALDEARIKANEEMEETLANCTHSLEQMQEYVHRHPELTTAKFALHKQGTTIGSAANYVQQIDNELNEHA